MLKRRHRKTLVPTLTNGPGALCYALNITRNHNGIILNGDTIWLEEREINIREEHIKVSSRIGIDYAQEDPRQPWRFSLSKSFNLSFGFFSPLELRESSRGWKIEGRSILNQY